MAAALKLKADTDAAVTKADRGVMLKRRLLSALDQHQRSQVTSPCSHLLFLSISQTCSSSCFALAALSDTLQRPYRPCGREEAAGSGCCCCWRPGVPGCSHPSTTLVTLCLGASRPAWRHLWELCPRPQPSKHFTFVLLMYFQGFSCDGDETQRGLFCVTRGVGMSEQGCGDPTAPQGSPIRPETPAGCSFCPVVPADARATFLS